MRARLLVGISLAVCMVAACGGTETESDDISGNPGGWSSVAIDGGTSFEAPDATAFSDDGGVTTGFADGGVGGDGGHHHRDGGVGSFDGGVGVTDGGISIPPPEDSGAQPPRDAGTLSGALLRDANGVVLGEIVSIQSEGAVFTVVTSNDYVVQIDADGTYAPPYPGSLLYSDVDCGGSISLEGNASESSGILGSTVIYSANRGLLLPEGPLANGVATSIPLSWQSAGDPCGNDGKVMTGFYGWPLVPTTAANIGLPEVIAAPLSYP